MSRTLQVLFENVTPVSEQRQEPFSDLHYRYMRWRHCEQDDSFYLSHHTVVWGHLVYVFQIYTFLLHFLLTSDPQRS